MIWASNCFAEFLLSMCWAMRNDMLSATTCVAHWLGVVVWWESLYHPWICESQVQLAQVRMCLGWLSTWLTIQWMQSNEGRLRVLCPWGLSGAAGGGCCQGRRSNGSSNGQFDESGWLWMVRGWRWIDWGHGSAGSCCFLLRIFCMLLWSALCAFGVMIGAGRFFESWDRLTTHGIVMSMAIWAGGLLALVWGGVSKTMSTLAGQALGNKLWSHQWGS